MEILRHPGAASKSESASFASPHWGACGLVAARCCIRNRRVQVFHLLCHTHNWTPSFFKEMLLVPPHEELSMYDVPKSVLATILTPSWRYLCYILVTGSRPYLSWQADFALSFEDWASYPLRSWAFQTRTSPPSVAAAASLAPEIWPRPDVAGRMIAHSTTMSKK